MLSFLITSVLPTLKNELPTPNAAGYDMTESFLADVREFMLAQAQECFWQQAVMRELARTRTERGVFFQLTPRRGIV